MTAIAHLDQQVKQVCPNADGVSIGRWEDKSTWHATGSLTPEEVTITQAIFDAFDVGAAQAAEVSERQRLAGLDTAISGDSTVQALKAMTNAQFDAWWDTNITTAAQAIAVLKRLVRVVLRRVL